MTDEYLRELNKPTVRVKLPVFRTVGGAYWAFLKNFTATLKVSLFTVLLFPPIYLAQTFADPTRQEDGFNSTNWFPNIALSLLYLFLGTVLTMGLTRLYLNDARPKGLIYFKFGAAELRLFLVSVVSIALFSAALLLLMTIFCIAGAGVLTLYGIEVASLELIN